MWNLSDHTWTFISLVEVLWVFASALFMVLQRRSATATLAWILVLAFLPLVGILFYLFLGPRRYNRRKNMRKCIYWERPFVRWIKCLRFFVCISMSENKIFLCFVCLQNEECDTAAKPSRPAFSYGRVTSHECEMYPNQHCRRNHTSPPDVWIQSTRTD